MNQNQLKIIEISSFTSSLYCSQVLFMNFISSNFTDYLILFLAIVLTILTILNLKLRNDIKKLDMELGGLDLQLNNYAKKL